MLSVISLAEEETMISVKASGVSIKVAKSHSGIRFKMTVSEPLVEGVEIVEKGVIMSYLYDVKENFSKFMNRYYLDELTLDTKNALKVVNDDVVGEGEFDFACEFERMPLYSVKAEVAARGYVTYSLFGGEAVTVYSDTVIYDVYSVAERVAVSDTETEENKTGAKSYILDAYDAYISGSTDEGLLTITSPDKDEEVYPYYSEAKKYVLEGALSKSYSAYDAAEAIKIGFNNQYDNTEFFTVMYATKEDFSDAKLAFIKSEGKRVHKVNVFNLFKGTTYYLKVVASLSDGTTRSATSTFKTTDAGPRVMHLDGSYNIRDLGGYTTVSGERTLQGLIYRGGQMDSTFSANQISTALSDYGKHVAAKELGIKVIFDFRSSEHPVVIPGARLIYVGVGAYRLTNVNYQAKIREAFSVLADKNNYPMIFHCQGGADRTGTIAYFLLAILGVPEADVIRDYEFTTYSVYGARAITSESYIAKPEYEFFTTLDSMEGDTFNERCENYLLSIGVTAEEIASIRSIMLQGIE